MSGLDPIERLVEAFRSLPGVGVKTAARYAYSVINKDEENAKEFAEAIINAKLKVKYCKECGNYTDGEICSMCAKRKADVICVVKEPKDIRSIEKYNDNHIDNAKNIPMILLLKEPYKYLEYGKTY